MNHQSTIQAAIAGAHRPRFRRVDPRGGARRPREAASGPGKVLRRRQGRPERLRHREARVRGAGRQGRQGPERMEVRRQGHVRADGRQVGSAEGLIGRLRLSGSRRTRAAGISHADDAARCAAGGRRHRLASAPRPAGRGDAAARPLVRGPQRELFRRWRTGAGRARTDSRRLPSFAARRRAFARLDGPARPSAPRQAREADRPRRAGARLRTSVLERRRGQAFQRSAAPSLHGRSARARVLARRRSPGPSRADDRRRKRFRVRRLRRIDDARMGIRRRRRAPDRLQAAPRRQQHLRQRRQPRFRRGHVSRDDAARTPSPRSTSPDSTRAAPASSTRTARASRRTCGRSIAGRLRGSDRARR